MKFSRYVTIQKLKEDKYLMINSLSGAIDVIDERGKVIIDDITVMINIV